MERFCQISSGSSGNSALLEVKNTKILIDAGTSARNINRALCKLEVTADKIDAILITHEHSDHISALKVLTKGMDVPIYMSYGTAKEVSFYIPEIEDKIIPFESGDEFGIGDIGVKSFPTSHDARDSVGYIFDTGRLRCAVATDLGIVPEETVEILSGSELLVIESNHDVDMLINGEYPYYLKRRIICDRGHLSNDACAKTVAKLIPKGAKKILLSHLSEHNNTARRALDTVMREIDESLGEDCTKEIRLSVAMRREITAPIML